MSKRHAQAVTKTDQRYQVAADRVEVIELKPPASAPDSVEKFYEWAVIRRGIAKGEDAQRLIQLWLDLPPTPTATRASWFMGLRFLRRDEVEMEAVINGSLAEITMWRGAKRLPTRPFCAAYGTADELVNLFLILTQDNLTMAQRMNRQMWLGKCWPGL